MLKHGNNAGIMKTFFHTFLASEFRVIKSITPKVFKNFSEKVVNKKT